MRDARLIVGMSILWLALVVVGYALAAVLACSSDAPMPGLGLEDVALTGKVVGQFDGQPKPGVRVRFAGATVFTDAAGRFEVPGSSSTSQRQLRLDTVGLVPRSTYARSADSLWKIVPATFNLAAYEDVARAFISGRTVRWIANPRVVIDTRRHCFMSGDVATWTTETRQQATAFVKAWTAGTQAAVVSATSSPPADFTTGTIVTRFSNCAADYGGGQFIGYARVLFNERGEVQSATVALRFNEYPTNPSKRKGILGHELGHALGYRHMFEPVASMMQPSIGTKTGLLAFDSLAARFMYGRFPRNAAPDSDPQYATTIKLARLYRWEGP